MLRALAESIHHRRSKATAIVATPIAAPSIAALNPCRTLSLTWAFAFDPGTQKRNCFRLVASRHKSLFVVQRLCSGSINGHQQFH